MSYLGMTLTGDEGDFQIDELHIGESWGDVTVVPELATMVLLGIGGIGVLIRRKRH